MNSLPVDATRYNGGPGFPDASVGLGPQTLPAFPASPARQSGSNPSASLPTMDRYVVTRASLADPSVARKPVTVLTGVWPYGPSTSVLELDAAIDGRFGWIDREAARLAELAAQGFAPAGSDPPPAWVNGLALRYYLLKLLRVIEFFARVQPPKKTDRLCVIADRSDRDLAALIKTLCRRTGAAFQVQWRGDPAEAGAAASEREQWWRGALRRLAERLPPRQDGVSGKRRVVLCGNPRFLDPVCEVLHRRKCRLWWLYDRFAVKPFLQWHSQGVGQLTCQGGPVPAFETEAGPTELPAMEFHGVDLRPLVADWLKRRLAERGPTQQRWQAQIQRHFRRIAPDLLVMDEDATPMKRIALAAARRHGGRSFVVQHGAPVARFGFAPPAADGIFAWGLSSREQLVKWEVPAEKIFLTGSPVHDSLYEAFRRVPRKQRGRDGPPRVLLLATVPPRDDRPDLVELNLNGRTYAEMIEAAFAAVEAIPRATLVLRLHPRTPKDEAVRAAVKRHPNVKTETSKGASLVTAMQGIDCVLSCLSSAGIEATLAGVPVIQLVPRGAGRILPHERWALFGSASCAKQLLPLMRAALQKRGHVANKALRDVFAGAAFWGRKSAEVPDAANRIADILTGQSKQNVSPSRTNPEQGSSKPVADA